MPVHYEKRSGNKPHKIVERGGRVVGSSTSAAKAKGSVRARNAAYRKK